MTNVGCDATVMSFHLGFCSMILLSYAQNVNLKLTKMSPLLRGKNIKQIFTLAFCFQTHFVEQQRKSAYNLEVLYLHCNQLLLRYHGGYWMESRLLIGNVFGIFDSGEQKECERLVLICVSGQYVVMMGGRQWNWLTNRFRW